jgi:hypothetical protein
VKRRYRLVGWNEYAYLFKDLRNQVTEIVPRHVWAAMCGGRWVR